MKKPSRERFVQFRINATSFDHMVELAESRGMTISAFCRGTIQAEVGTYLGKLKEHMNERVEN